MTGTNLNKFMNDKKRFFEKNDLAQLNFDKTV